MIRLTDVSLTYGDGDARLTAVDRVSLTAHPGTVTAVTGPSGSGKSSLLAVAATLVRPDSGRLEIDGADVTRLSDADASTLRRSTIGIVFQQPNLLPSLTAREQLEVVGRLGGARARAGMTERARELLAAVGLEREEAKRPHQLSGGQRQRVNIARALMGSPSVLLVDEPTSALDQARGAQVMDLIVALTREFQTATLLVTHDTSYLPRMDAVAHMVDGRLSMAPAA